MPRTLTVTHNGIAYTGEIATVERTHLGPEDHGIWTFYLTFSGEGWGVQLGGFDLRVHGIEFLQAVVETAGVETWEDLRGTQLIVLFDGAGHVGERAVGFAHLTDENRVLILSDFAAGERKG